MRRVLETASFLAKNDIRSIGAFRTTDELARRYLFGDIRENGKLAFVYLACLFELDRQISPNDQKAPEKNIRFTEHDIHRALQSYTLDLPSISSLLLPGHEMANWVNKEVAIAKSKDRPFSPYLAPKMAETHWMPADSDHTSARTIWDAYAKQDKRSFLPQELSIQALTLYQLRFVFSADFCSDWSKFGGLGPQIAHLSTVLHIGIAESVGTALAYHRIVGTNLKGGSS